MSHVPVSAGKRAARIRTPWREHLAQHFGTTHTRVALPELYPSRPRPPGPRHSLRSRRLQNVITVIIAARSSRRWSRLRPIGCGRSLSTLACWNVQEIPADRRPATPFLRFTSTTVASTCAPSMPRLEDR